MKILIAEDDGGTRLLLTTLLEKAGHEVLVASDGSQAMTEFRKPDAPGLALLDWEMPNMDGLEVSRRVRERGVPTYLMLLTKHNQKQNIIEGLKSGVDAYITKPFDSEELLMRIQVGVRTMNAQRALTQQLNVAHKILENVRGCNAELTLPI